MGGSGAGSISVGIKTEVGLGPVWAIGTEAHLTSERGATVSSNCAVSTVPRDTTGTWAGAGDRTGAGAGSGAVSSICVESARTRILDALRRGDMPRECGDPGAVQLDGVH